MTDLRGLSHELVRLETELWNSVDARLRAELSIPLVQYEPLRVIASCDPCRVLDIAAELIITNGGASKLVDRIEVAGWCERLPNPADRRSSLLRLTPSGRSILARADDTVARELERLLRGVVSDEALTQLASTLSALRTPSRHLPREVETA